MEEVWFGRDFASFYHPLHFHAKDPARKSIENMSSQQPVFMKSTLKSYKIQVLTKFPLLNQLSVHVEDLVRKRFENLPRD
jgi:hypothetical protein